VIFGCTSRGVSLGPDARHLVVLLAVLDKLSRDCAHQWIRWIAVREEGTNGEENFGDGEGRTPVVFQDVETYHTGAVDVAVINSSSEGDFRWLEGIVGGE